MRILNYEVKFSVEKRHSFWDLFSSPDLGYILPDCEPIIGKEIKPWKLEISPEKRLHAMHSDVLVYAFRDIVHQMLMYPNEAGSIFLGIVAFTEAFKNNMITKGANIESIVEYDEAVDAHIEITLNNIKRNNPEIYESVLECLEDD